MEAVALFLLKSVAWLTGFLLVYLLFLRNDRFFAMKRYYLIAGIIASFLFPLVSFHYSVVITATPVNPAVQSPAVPGGSLPSAQALPDEGISPQLLAAGIYLTMVLILTVRLIKQTYFIRSMISREDNCQI